MQMNNRRLVVIFGDNYRDLSFGSILDCLSKCCTVIDPLMVLEFRMDTRQPDEIRLFFSSSTELETALYIKAVERLAELSRYVPLEGAPFSAAP